MNVLLIGSGGREHALAWKIAQSPACAALHAAPGNPGISALGDCHPVRADDVEGVLGLARSLAADLVVVGPEVPLVAGLADELRQVGIPVFGPGAGAARIEGSKGFAKDLMVEAGVPTAARLAAARVPCVVKADGLAAGKGVFVCTTQAELDEGLAAAASLGGDVVVEELLEGPEVSLFALCDGERALALPPAQDFKRAFDGDEGPNTGGMGSYAPYAGLTGSDVEELIETVHRPVLRALVARGTPFVGLLYAGLMLAADGPRVIEFNCRFGDPETQALLPLLEGDLLPALLAAATGDLSGVEVALRTGAAVSIVLAARGYPSSSDDREEITGIEDAEALGSLVFHAGTAFHDGRLVTHGGRILNVTGLGSDLAAARQAAYAGADLIRWDGVRRREDIALRAATSGLRHGVHAS